MTASAGYDYFDVEADVGVRAWGSDHAEAFAQAVKRPAVQQQLGGLGIQLVGSTSAEMQAFLTTEAAKAEDAVKMSGAKME